MSWSCNWSAPTEAKPVQAGSRSETSGSRSRSGDKIVVPIGTRQTVLFLLHAAHTGVTKTTRTARQFYFWPGMARDINHLVAECDVCQSLRPSNAAAFSTRSMPASFPMDALGTDIFHCGGKDWVVVVDRYSGFHCMCQLHSLTSAAVICRLDSSGSSASPIVSAPRGRSPVCEFRNFLVALDIKHKVSSPYNLASNGITESGVKQVRHLMIKCSAEGTCYDRTLHAYRSTHHGDGFSPFPMFGRTGKFFLPAIQTALHPTNPASAAEARRQATEKWATACTDRHRKCIYHPGDLVFVQDPIGGTWTKGRVQASNDTGSYVVEFKDGACKSQNENYLCLQKSASAPDSGKSDPPPADHAPITHNDRSSLSVPQIPPVPVGLSVWHDPPS